MDDREPVNDLALLKTASKIIDANLISLPTCNHPIPRHKTNRIKLGACGMGSIRPVKGETEYATRLQVRI